LSTITKKILNSSLFLCRPVERTKVQAANSCRWY